MKNIISLLVSFISIGIALIYFTSCLTPFISQAQFWPLTFLMLGFVFIAVAMLLATIYWLFKNVKIGLLFLLLFLVGYKNLGALYAFNFSSFHQPKKPDDLRILHWNVRHFVENGKMYDWPYAVRRKIFDYIKQMDPDVLLMQEFLEINGKDYYSNLALFDSMGYKYHYLSKDEFAVKHDMTSTYGCAVISKTPISDTQSINFPTVPHEKIVFGDIVFNGRKIRLYTMHLTSLDLGPPDDRSEFYGRVDKNFLLHKSRMQKIKYYDSIHARQAKFVRQLLNKSPYPVVLSGDFNSVPGGYTYHTIKGKLQDAFVEKGYGFGRTFSGLSPTLRIDYIFVDNQFKVHQYTAPAMYLSDHFPVVADVSWR